MNYNKLPGLNPSEYQHKGEIVAMKTLQAIPVFDKLVAMTIDNLNMIQSYPRVLGDNFRINEKTDKRVYDLYKLALSRLDFDEEFPLFCECSYDYNAYTTGIEKPYVVLTSSVVNDYSDGELLAIIGHELGHVKSKHVLYHGMANELNNIIAKFGGIGTTLAIGIKFALMEWYRNSEYTADRAGLIASANIEDSSSKAIRSLGCTAKIKNIDISTDKIIGQADEISLTDMGIIDKLIYADATASMTHPWTILRIKQINDWYNSGEFEKIVKKHSI